MMDSGWLIPRYLLRNIAPYFAFSWVLLSVILFVQQAGRFADIFFSVNIPARLVFELTFALVPNVIAFTCPMAVLIGVVIGLSKMQGDSELIAIRAIGVGNLRIALPVVLLGAALSLFAFFINTKGVPFASSIVRAVALRTALLKLESPIEPGSFNTDVAGYTIFVRNGNLATGSWERIFIYNEDRKNGVMRLITAGTGRIDSTIEPDREVAELVLTDGQVTTVPIGSEGFGKIDSERLGEIRLTIRTRRDEIVKRLAQTEEAPEEMGLGELAELARRSEGRERTEAQILWQRRVMLSVAPIIFALLGTVLVLRFNRGGRGFGAMLALVSLVGYYLTALLGEQLMRTGAIGAAVAGFLPVAASLVVIGWFFARSGRIGTDRFAFLNRWRGRETRAEEVRPARSNFFIDLTSGIRDFDIVTDVLKYFLLTLGFLASVYLIFTTFELWKFAGSMPGGVALLGSYLFYLLPFIYLQLAPSALMIAALATFVIKARNNELVTWASAGQSVYRLLAPCLGLAMAIGFVNWGIQETIAPAANRIQDDLRSRIRSRGAPPTQPRYWAASGNRIYSFAAAEGGRANETLVFEFDSGMTLLQSVSRASSAEWKNGNVRLNGVVRASGLASEPAASSAASVEFADRENPFDNLSTKPSHLTSAGTRTQLSESESATERRNLATALYRKHLTLLLPLVITLFTAPFAMNMTRKGKAAVTVGYAVAVWLVFVGISSAFEQAGLSGSLPPSVAVFAPPALFAAVGIFLLARGRT